MSLATSNAFAALDTKRKKKGSKSKEDSGPKKPKAPSKEDQAAQLERVIFSQPAAAGVSNWADTDEEDSFDGGGFGAAPAWLQNAPPEAQPTEQPAEEGPESEEEDHEDIENELGIEITKDADEEEEERSEADGDAAESSTTESKSASAPMSRPVLEPIPPERQLSKKEQKAKGMEELNAVLAELGLEPSAAGDAEGSQEAGKPKKERKKKKPAEDGHPNGKVVEAAPEVGFVAPAAGPNSAEPDPDASAPPAQVVDPAEAKRLLAKKKAPSKKAAGGSAAAAAAAAKEAKERAKKKGKSKDSSHYNQAPTR